MMFQMDSGAKRRKAVGKIGRRHSIEPLEERCLLNADAVIELKLDVTQEGQSILNDARQFAVEVGDRFDLELLYDDKRPIFFNHMGAFTVYADILADNAHAYRPVLSETQILTIDETLNDAIGGSLQLSSNGRTATIPLVGASSLAVNPVLAIREAIEGPDGLNFGAGTVTVFEALRSPRNADGDVGSGDPFDYIIRFVADEFEFADAPNIHVDTSGLVISGGGAAPIGEVLEIPVFTDQTTETINPEAFYYNLDARSASLNDKVVYGNVRSGTFDPSGGDGSEVFNELGGTGPLESTGLRAVAESVFGADSPEYGAFLSPISNVEVFSIELEAIAVSNNVNFTLDRADDERSELSAYGIDTALTAEQVLIDLDDDPNVAGDDRFGMAFGTIVDHPSVIVTPVAGLQTREDGSSQTFTIALGALPLADVVIALSSSDTSEGTVSPQQITLTPANATTPRTITVSGVNDLIDDGDAEYSIITAPIVSNDPFYHGIDPDDVVVRNLDDDGTGIRLSKTSGLTTTEDGGTDTFTVVLDSQPTATVTIPLVSSDPNEATLSANSLTFNTANWNTPQTVTVTGRPDRVDDDDAAFTIITHAAISSDAGYSGLAAADVTGINRDVDVAGISLVGTENLVVNESGTQTATFRVALDTVPVSPVTLNLSVSDSSEASLSNSSIVFTPANGTEPISVTVTGLNDDFDDGDVLLTIVTVPSTDDSKYQSIDVPDIAVTNLDDDTAEVLVAAPASPTTSESGGSFEISIVLSTIPFANVVIPITSSDPSEASVSESSITFTPANALTPQTVTVSGVDDTVLDGDTTVTVQLGPSVSNDEAYGGRGNEVVLTNFDDELPPPEIDFGDAPADYPTTLQSNGARHTGSDLFLGSAPTLERDGRPSNDADADDADDGVVFLTDIVVSESFGSTSSLRVNASGAGKLDAWIDFNHDDDWTDPAEQIAVSLTLQAGDNIVPISIPAGADPGRTFGRFRFSSAGGLASFGAADDGEVEDYQVMLVDGDAGAQVGIQTETGETSIHRDEDLIVVTQNERVLFSADHSLLLGVRVDATRGDDTLSYGDLGSATLNVGFNAGDGNDAIVWPDDNQSIDLRTQSQWFSDVESISMIGEGSDAIVLDAAAIAEVTASENRLTLRLDPKDAPSFLGDWKVTRFESEGEEFFHVLTLDGVTLRITGYGDWTNPLQHLDVNNSGEVTAIDVLQILNQLHRKDLMVGLSGLVSAVDLGPDFPGRFYDTNRDTLLTPIDALRVINYVARRTAGSGEFPQDVPPIQVSVSAIVEDATLETESRLQESSVERISDFGSPASRQRIDRTPPPTDSESTQKASTQSDPLEEAFAQWLL
ncbi:hypothetical protein Poly24_34420 [Rosistilla carotiformis]|uniref:GEVED domain-containing protein n=1 Tax=Rosistilla carotiformis TaxID=2528017 RepID=A0A518JW10_9BACT|nr:GEVED domain-containing protein [Rosistilla carotiformis]QDV69725.1 hypothetical protein Poly24_34420 [Rosistilla carotiformis]